MGLEYLEPVSYEFAKMLVPNVHTNCRYFLYTTLTATVLVAKDPNFQECNKTADDDGTYEYTLEEMPKEKEPMYREPIIGTRNSNMDNHYKVIKLCVLMFCAVCACIAYKLLLVLS